MKLKNKIILIVMMAFLIKMPSLAIDLNEFGDFSSRSVIMNSFSGKNYITQKQRDILKSRKLTPTTKCLIEEIKKGHIDNVSVLLDAKIDPNGNYMGNYPIYVAAKYNKFEILKMLTEYGAKPDKGFYSELYEAVRNKNKAMAQFLIEQNAKVNYNDSLFNNSILSMALKNNLVEIASQLIKKGAKIDLKSYKLLKKKKLLYLIESK